MVQAGDDGRTSTADEGTQASGSRPVFGRVHCPDEDYLARAQPEDALEPDVPIIDTHLHLWHLEDCRPYLLPEYACDLAASGHDVRASVFVECNAMYRSGGPERFRPIGETEFAAGMAAMADSHRYTSSRVAAGIVAYADLTQGAALPDVLEAHLQAANGRLRGVRQRAKWDADPIVKGPISADAPGLYLEKRFGAGLDVLASYGLSFDASIFHPQIAEVLALARAHPDASIVLIHCGSPVGHGAYAGQTEEVHAEWLRNLRDLAKCPNVTVKLGGLLINLGNFDFTKAAAPPGSDVFARLWRPWIEPCVEAFGADRCMVSSNFPVERAALGYGTLWNTFKRMFAGCSDAEKRQLFADTARRVYRID